MIKHSILWFHVWDSPTWSQNWQSKPNHEERNTTFTWASSFLLLTLQSNIHIKSISEAFCNWRSRSKLHWLCVCVCCHVLVAFLPAFFFRLKRWTAEEQHDQRSSRKVGKQFERLLLVVAQVLQWDGGVLNCHSWDLSSCMTSFNLAADFFVLFFQLHSNQLLLSQLLLGVSQAGLSLAHAKQTEQSRQHTEQHTSSEHTNFSSKPCWALAYLYCKSLLKSCIAVAVHSCPPELFQDGPLPPLPVETQWRCMASSNSWQPSAASFVRMKRKNFRQDENVTLSHVTK